MHTPRIRIYGWSWLGVVNFLLFQWLFVRLQGSFENNSDNMKLSWLVGVVPLTGWWSRYRWVHRG